MPSNAIVEQALISFGEFCASTTHTPQAPAGLMRASWHRVGMCMPFAEDISKIVWPVWPVTV